jgi:hypothetical protein
LLKSTWTRHSFIMSRNSQLGRALTVQTIHALYEHLQKSYLHFNRAFPIFLSIDVQTSKIGYMQFCWRKIKARHYPKSLQNFKLFLNIVEMQ